MDTSGQIFDLTKIETLDILQGQVEATFTVTAFYEVSNANGELVIVETSVFDIVIKNPCIDPMYFQIVPPVPLPDIEYTLGKGPETYAPHGGFSV